MIKIYPSAKKLRAASFWCALIFFSFYLLKNTARSTDAVTGGLLLCFTRVVPSLFPYMVVSSLVLSSGLAAYMGRLLARPCSALFALNGNCAAAIIIGLVSGFPVGAKTAAATYTEGLCDKEEAERLCSFCNNTGPAFLIGAVGTGFFGDGRVGAVLWVIQAAASLILGGLLSIGKSRKARRSRAPIPFHTDFVPAVKDAVNGVIGVCGFVVFFYVLTDTMRAILPTLPLTACAAFLEVTCGCEGASRLGGTGGFILAAFAVGWSGLCVHAQSAAFIMGAGLSIKKYILGKLAQGGICAALAFALCVFSQNL